MFFPEVLVAELWKTKAQRLLHSCTNLRQFRYKIVHIVSYRAGDKSAWKPTVRGDGP